MMQGIKPASVISCVTYVAKRTFKIYTITNYIYIYASIKKYIALFEFDILLYTVLNRPSHFCINAHVMCYKIAISFRSEL